MFKKLTSNIITFISIAILTIYPNNARPPQLNIDLRLFSVWFVFQKKMCKVGLHEVNIGSTFHVRSTIHIHEDFRGMFGDRSV